MGRAAHGDLPLSGGGKAFSTEKFSNRKVRSPREMLRKHHAVEKLACSIRCFIRCCSQMMSDTDNAESGPQHIFVDSHFNKCSVK